MEAMGLVIGSHVQLSRTVFNFPHPTENEK